MPQSAIFDFLRSERKQEWLHAVFVPPQFLNQIGGDRLYLSTAIESAAMEIDFLVHSTAALV